MLSKNEVRIRNLRQVQKVAMIGILIVFAVALLVFISSIRSLPTQFESTPSTYHPDGSEQPSNTGEYGPETIMAKQGFIDIINNEI
jgi:hypothetical protein